MTRILTLAALPLLAAPASASPAIEPFCREIAAVVYMGVVDGQNVSEFDVGFVKATVSVPADPTARRVALSAYMAGYSAGLLDGDPASAAADFYNACVSDPA